VPEHATVTYREGERPDRKFERIIGKSTALESVLAEVEQVAPTDSTVLFLFCGVPQLVDRARTHQNGGLAELSWKASHLSPSG